MSSDARSTHRDRAASLPDAHLLAVALLMVGLAAGTLLPELSTNGPAFPTPRSSGLGASDDQGRPADIPVVNAGRSKPSSPGALDLNTADREGLQALSGVGPVLAERIVAYRETHGPFRAPEDLLQVPGVGHKRWERIRGLVKVGEGAGEER